ncbi:hypothetical protein ABKV19_014004, partial [Rosa sericea]
ASTIFVGVYEPTKQKLLKSLPENFSALVHLVFRHQSDCRCYWRCFFFYCTSANRAILKTLNLFLSSELTNSIKSDIKSIKVRLGAIKKKRNAAELSEE